MLITHKFLGTKIGTAKCLCFVLYEDYIEQQAEVARALDLEFERLARRFGDSGLVVRAFQGDIETAMSDVLEKNWSECKKNRSDKHQGYS